MKYSFAELGTNIMTRKFGGTKAGVADPYVTGYHFITFDSLPARLADYTSGFNSGLSSVNDISSVLMASCLSVTPPGGTLNKVEFTGLGGIKYSVPGNIDYGNSVSIKFVEFSKTPILDIFSGWFKLIRDYRTGVTDLISGDTGEGYSKKAYAASMYYWTTSPDGQSVEFFAYYDGMFPTKDPADLYGSDVETVGRLDVEIEFNVDYAWREPWVLNKCKTLAEGTASVKDLVKAYNQS